MLKKKVFGSSLFFLNALVLLFILTKSERILQQFNNETNQYPPGAEICSAKGQMMAYLFDVGLDIPLRVVQVITFPHSSLIKTRMKQLVFISF